MPTKCALDPRAYQNLTRNAISPAPGLADHLGVGLLDISMAAGSAANREDGGANAASGAQGRLEICMSRG